MKIKLKRRISEMMYIEHMPMQTYIYMCVYIYTYTYIYSLI